jgi:hypothetical protein
MRRKVSVVHWSPVEMYPPAINLVRFLADTGRWDVSLHTTWNGHERTDFRHPGVNVHRSANPSGKTGVAKVAAYAAFQAQTTSRLLSEKPDAVIYFEPMSSLPVYFAAGPVHGRSCSFITTSITSPMSSRVLGCESQTRFIVSNRGDFFPARSGSRTQIASA